MEYSEKLKDPRWQKVRLEVFNRDGWRCQSCGNIKTMLVVHHLYYLKKTDPWSYPLDALITLCYDCHQEEYEDRKQHEYNLLLLLKEKGFLCGNIEHLVGSLSFMILQDTPSKITDVYGWAFSNPAIQEMLINLWDKESNG